MNCENTVAVILTQYFKSLRFFSSYPRVINGHGPQEMRLGGLF